MPTTRAAVLTVIYVVLFAAARALPVETEPGGGVSFTVTPAATGLQVVRVSLPLPPGFLATNQACAISVASGAPEPAALRVLSWHPATGAAACTARRALVTFPHRFAGTNPVVFALQPAKVSEATPGDFPVALLVEGESYTLAWQDGRKMDLKFIAPPRASREQPRMETVEENRFFRWQRLHFPDRQWPRIIEFRFDTVGTVVAVGHLQRVETNDCYAPEMGWELSASARSAGLSQDSVFRPANGGRLSHSFASVAEVTCLLDDQLVVYHPTAPRKHRGQVELLPADAGRWTYRYVRCQGSDKVPMQPMAWQRAEVVIAPSGLAHLTSSLSYPHRVEPQPKLWARLYGEQEPLPKLPPRLDRLVRYHRDAIVSSAAVGDDFGNVTAYQDGVPHGPTFGMNRLNHGAAIFQTGWRAGDRRLTETGVLWCDNFFDQSIWWGEPEPGGTRYNNRALYSSTPDKDYMWRSDTSVSFCTKGYDCFWLAWEETGDPRMLEAFRAQVAYAAKFIHADTGECRNIGDVRDFIRLYRYTGQQAYLNDALRLFRELRTKLSTGHLFDQGGKPLDPDPPFIEEDARGLKVGYAKPYIIGYALAGLPELMPFAPNEPDLKETVRAVADFLASTVDPAGGWRYPHPRSSSVSASQGLEHAWHLTQAARALGPDPRWLDAIEIVLRARIHGWQRTGKIFSSLSGWEISTGRVKDPMDLYALYKKPADRDTSRDYREGKPGFGSAPPEGIVYFEEVLGYYLQHRPAVRLLAEPKPDEPLGLVLARAPRKEQ
jgi:hypothetical protein